MAEKQQQQQQSSNTKNISNISRRRQSPQIQQTSSSNAEQQSTPSPPLNEQSPQLLIGNNNDNVDQHQRSQLHLSGMRTAQSLAEWQLQAVLFRARLTQYFDVFISQGGDDIDQIMQCDETEFLEIMSLVGMASKPLHVRRLQRTLSEFSVNRAQFLITTVPFIGLPPIEFPSTSSTTDNLTAALQFLVPGYLPSTGIDLTTTLTQQQQLNNPPFIDPDFLFPLNPTPPVTTTFQQNNVTSTFPPSLSLSQHILLSLVNPTTTSSILQNHQQPFIDNFNKRARMSFSPPPNTPPTSVLFTKEAKEEPEQINNEEMRLIQENTTIIQNQTPSYSSCSSPAIERLNENEMHRLSQLATELIALLPPKLEPKITGHGKKRLERGLLEAIEMPQEDPLRVEHFRLFSRIYGRFDAKRRSDRTLTRHERIVNESAAQLCLLRPELLTRRDELFPLARKLARMFELPSGNNSFSPSILPNNNYSINNAHSSASTEEHAPISSFSGEDIVEGKEEKYKREQVEEDEEEEELKEEDEMKKFKIRENKERRKK
ncbi:hypothetical protein ACQ4LE_007778 [Meloidogyne hapla]